MCSNRLQKLLFSEYCDFEDMVLLESPFAQTTKDGKGIRQVHLGLTPSKLLVATDVLPPVEYEKPTSIFGIDPETETFELIAVYPVECVNLSVYRKKKRQALKAHFCNNRIYYFELGGFERRSMFWNLWCEKLKFLYPAYSGSSRSETSVATSTTGSSLYIVDKRLVKANGIRQLWYKFGSNLPVENGLINGILEKHSQDLTRKWTDKYLFLGEDLVENALNYIPLGQFSSNGNICKTKRKKHISTSESSTVPLMVEKNLQFGDSVQVNRFGSGVNEGCNIGLYMTVDNYITPERYETLKSGTSTNSKTNYGCDLDFDELAESIVLFWEFYNYNDPKKYKIRHRRRYGFAPKPLLLYGCGPWSLSPGGSYSVQIKRASSEVSIRTISKDPELSLPVSKRQLLATVSCPCVLNKQKYIQNNLINTHNKPAILFWTTDYWFRPVSGKDAYSLVRRHMKKLKTYQEMQSERSKRKRCTIKRIKQKLINKKETDTDEEDNSLCPRQTKKKSLVRNIFGLKSYYEVTNLDRNKPKTNSIQDLKRDLSLSVIMSAWDFDSTTLAQNLTMIDRDLLLKIPSTELRVVIWQKNSRNAPNIAAMVVFAYRLSCLISTEILNCDSERSRARLIARFINVANKCHRISNFHSCRTVLCGLQNPAIYRLRRTWAYVRKKHASKYQMFEFLCRLYRDPRMPEFQKKFFIFSQYAPYLPYIGHILAKLLNKIPKYRMTMLRKHLSRQTSLCPSVPSNNSAMKNSESHTNMFLKLLKMFSPPVEECSADFSQIPKNTKNCKLKSQEKVAFKSLHEYYKPLDEFEDNRVEGLVEATSFLEKCQLSSLHYNFTVTESARSFLLKARYREEQECFFVSLSVEPTYCDVQNSPNTKSNNKNINKYFL